MSRRHPHAWEAAKAYAAGWPLKVISYEWQISIRAILAAVDRAALPRRNRNSGKR